MPVDAFQDEMLLSICIPTYNRGLLLDQLLKSIVRQSAFDNSVEIIISDNCSTDDTELIVKNYMATLNNLKYYKNSENIGMEENIAQVLALGNGKYLKLLNDYSILEKESLKKIITLVKDNCIEKPTIYFKNSIKNRCIKSDYRVSFGKLLKKESAYFTWIGSFGIWKEELNKIANKEKLVGTMFYHVRLFIESIKGKESILILEGKLFSAQKLDSKGGYNLFNIFVNNYIGLIITNLYKEFTISLFTLYLIKSNFYKRFIINWLIKVFIVDKNKYKFEKKNWYKIIYKQYKYYPLMYLSIFYITIYYLFYKAKNVLPKSF